MSSEPISLLPGGTPSDTTLLPQSTGFGGVTQKITALQLFNYTVAKSLNNVIYVSSVNGVDASGRGGILNPYASLSYAFNNITAASASNPFAISIMGGKITDSAGQIIWKPYVSVIGAGTYSSIINNSSPIIINGTQWLANPGGFISLQDILIMGDISFDFTSIIAVNAPTILISNIQCTGTLSSKGNSTLNPLLEIGASILNHFTVDNSNITVSSGNTYQTVVMGGSSTLASNSFNSNGDKIGSFSGTSTSNSGNYYFSSILGLTSLTLTGANTNLKTDSSSLNTITPTLASGATITLEDTAANIFATSTRSSFTPTSATVEGNLQGLDNELNIGTGRIPFGVVGGGILSDPAFTYDLTSHTQAVNNLRINLMITPGVLHNNNLGNLSSSLVVDADVSSSANITYSKINSQTLGAGWDSVHVLLSPVTLTNPCPNFIHIDSTSTGPGPIILPPMNVSNSLSSSNNTFIFIKCSPSVSGPVVIFDSANNNLFTIYPGQIYLLTVRDNTNQGDFNITLLNPFLTAASPLAVDVAGNLTIQAADATHNGYLKSTDWTIFNNKLTSISTSNLVFVNYTNGTDVSTSGSLNQPFKTWSYAETQITTATSTNPFTIIILGGQLNDTGTINKKPYINVKGETAGTIVNNFNPIVLDSSFASSSGSSVTCLQDLTVNQMNFDASGFSGSSVSALSLANIRTNSSLSVKGNASILFLIYLNSNYIGTSNFDCAEVISNGNNLGIANFGTISLAKTTYFISTGDNIANLSLTGPSSGFQNIYFIYSAQLSAAPTLAGNNCTVNIDAGSLGNFTPTITSGTPVVNLQTGDTSVKSAYTPVHFTKTASTVRGMIQGIDNILTSFVGQPTTQIVLGNGASGITSSANLTYVSSQVIVSGAANSGFIAAGSQSFFGIGSTSASTCHFAFAGVAGNWFTNSAAGDAILRADSTSNFLRLGVGAGTSQISISNTLVSSNVSVAIGATSANASCILDVVSTTKGIGNASGTTTQKNAISSPRAGTQFFDTTLDKLCIFTVSTGWQTVTSV